MKHFKFITLLLLLLALIISITKKEETIFEASDELHFVHLFKEEQNFILLHNGINSAKGKFEIKGDSIFLDYNQDEILENENLESVHANEILTRVLLIEKKKVKSIDGKLFCADIIKNEISTKIINNEKI